MSPHKPLIIGHASESVLAARTNSRAAGFSYAVLEPFNTLSGYNGKAGNICK